MERIARSEPYLRSALTGAGNHKLKTHNAFVPDDDTPEAKFYASPGQVKDADDLRRFSALTAAIQSGYYWTLKNFGPRPRARDFFATYIRSGPVGNVSLLQLQTDWDAFVAANAALPPLRDTDFAPDGLEVFTLVLADLSGNDPAPVQQAAQWYDQWKKQQQPLVPAVVPPGHGQSTAGPAFLPQGYGHHPAAALSGNIALAAPAIDPWNQQVINKITAACLGQPVDAKRVETVLATWRTNSYVGSTNIDKDVQRGLDYIFRRNQ